jgi:hypothetical protein
MGGADPAGDPKDFIPGSEAYVFDVAEWRWDKQPWIDARTNSAGNLTGFGLVLGLSDGGNTDAVEVWEHGSRGPILKERQDTRVGTLVSHGETNYPGRSAESTTDQRFGSRCSGWRLIGKRHEPHRWPALDSADGGSALCPEEESVSRALVRRTLLPSPC